MTLKVPTFLLESDVRFYCSHMVILFQINLRLECSTGANIVSLWGVMPVCLKCGEFPPAACRCLVKMTRGVVPKTRVR